MSEENVEIVRRYFESTSGSEQSEPASRTYAEAARQAAEFWEDDGDYYPVRKFPEARPCHGRAEVKRFLTEVGEAWGSFRIVVEDARAVGDDRVFVHARFEAEGRATGLALEGDLYYCFWLRHGRFIRQEDHLTAKGALRALGLSGETLDAAGLSE